MTYEEALKIAKIELEIFDGEKEFENNVELQKLIVNALEKQILQKPTMHSNGTHYCECGNTVKSYQQFCDYCGQAIDWGE